MSKVVSQKLLHRRPHASIFSGSSIFKSMQAPTSYVEPDLIKPDIQILDSNETKALQDMFLSCVTEGNIEKVKFLLSKSAQFDLDHKDPKTGDTALLVSARRGYLSVVKMLLSAGLDPTLQNYQGETVLDIGTSHIKKVILESVHRSECSSKLFLQACWQASFSDVKYQLKKLSDCDINNCCNADNVSPLILLVRDMNRMNALAEQFKFDYRPIEVLQLLIANKILLDQCDVLTAKTALHFVASSTIRQAKSIITTLLNNKVNIDCVDNHNYTPLHCACQVNNITAAKEFLNQGATVNVSGNVGTTPLHLSSMYGFEEITSLLVTFGADIDGQDKSGQTPKDVAKSVRIKNLLEGKPVVIEPVKRNPAKLTLKKLGRSRTDLQPKLELMKNRQGNQNLKQLSVSNGHSISLPSIYPITRVDVQLSVNQNFRTVDYLNTDFRRRSSSPQGRKPQFSIGPVHANDFISQRSNLISARSNDSPALRRYRPLSSGRCGTAGSVSSSKDSLDDYSRNRSSSRTMLFDIEDEASFLPSAVPLPVSVKRSISMNHLSSIAESNEGDNSFRVDATKAKLNDLIASTSTSSISALVDIDNDIDKDKKPSKIPVGLQVVSEKSSSNLKGIKKVSLPKKTPISAAPIVKDKDPSVDSVPVKIEESEMSMSTSVSLPEPKNMVDFQIQTELPLSTDTSTKTKTKTGPITKSPLPKKSVAKKIKKKPQIVKEKKKAHEIKVMENIETEIVRRSSIPDIANETAIISGVGWHITTNSNEQICHIYAPKPNVLNKYPVLEKIKTPLSSARRSIELPSTSTDVIEENILVTFDEKEVHYDETVTKSPLQKKDSCETLKAFNMFNEDDVSQSIQEEICVDLDPSITEEVNEMVINDIDDPTLTERDFRLQLKVDHDQQFVNSPRKTNQSSDDWSSVFLNKNSDANNDHDPMNDTIGSMSSIESGGEDHELNWRKGKRLGAGSYGEVWEGFTDSGNIIAVKEIRIPTEDVGSIGSEVRKIKAEIDILKNLSHKHIVQFLGTHSTEDIVYIYMEFIPGGSLKNLLDKFGAFEERVCRRYTRQIVNGVAFLHDNDIIHRDIKGHNVMVMNNGVVKLIDFGCAKRLQMHMSVSGSEAQYHMQQSLEGSPFWMSPEMVRETGHGPKSDCWSIGCTLLEMATTRPPFSHMTAFAAIYAIGNGDPSPPEMDPKFSSEMCNFYSSCLIREPSLRPSSRQLLEHPFLKLRGRDSSTDLTRAPTRQVTTFSTSS